MNPANERGLFFAYNLLSFFNPTGGATPVLRIVRHEAYACI